ncbi:MAG: opgD [Hyphomicrobiales bacterium]|nr:opgD [Hyphomicrobiales bacterium]
MPELTRRAVTTFLAAGSGLTALGLAAPGLAQQASPGPTSRFGFEEVQRRARDLAGAPYEPARPLPEALQKLEFDAWRDIRFRSDRAFLDGTSYRLHTFHLGHLYRRPVTVNIIRDGIATPIPYSASLFDYGRTKFEKPLPINLGFAGFRLHHPLNDPKIFDEVISFLGASYFRLLGRGQRYGISARGIAINSGGQPEEFPHFHEFWIETPDQNSDRVSVYALLDGESLTGAYRFDLQPGLDSFVDVSVSLYPRRPIAKLGIAPLTSMFFVGENDRRVTGDYRPELHDSDGLLIHSGTGEWIWRPLRNPARPEISGFMDRDVRGFGLVQRDRNFEHYQDLDLNYEMRPSYWVEPRGGWGEGRVELVELPTTDESNDNVVASWVPNAPVEPGKPLTLEYRITSSLDLRRQSPNARVINTYQTEARALGSHEPVTPGSRRFIVDFAGGELRYFQPQPDMVELVPTVSNGRITRSFMVPNPQTGGFRAAIDIALEPGQSTDLRAFLKAGTRTLTETWTYPWRAE